MSPARSALLAVSIVLGALPLWGGWEAQRAFVEAMEGLERAGGGHVRVASSFERGWLASRATTRLEPVGGTGGLGALTLHHELIHGPLPFGELLKGRLPSGPVRAIVETRFALGPDGATLPLPSLRARTRILFDGASRIQIDSEPRRSDDGTLVWEGARGTLVSPPGGFETLTGRVRAPRLELRTEAGTFRVEDLSVGVDSDGRAGELPLGRFESQVARLALERPGSRMQLTGLHFEETGSLDVVNDTYRLTVRAGFEQLELDAGRYGPGAFELVFRNLDPGALEALQALQQPGVAGGDPGDPTQHPLQGALQLLPRLLRSSPELELTRLDLEGDAGALRIRAKLGVDGEDERVLMGPLSALAAVRAKADAYASATLLHAAVESFAAAQLRETGLGPDALADDPSRIRVLRDRILSGLEGGGVLYPEGDGYRLRADYRDGQLYLNGIPVDPGALTGAPPITARSSR